MSHLADDWRFLAVVALLFAAGVGTYLWQRRPHDPEETERRRRAHLNQVGRIAEGCVIEILEAPATPPRPRRGFFGRNRETASAPTTNGGRHLVCYSYAISGVSYETAQDVTGLEARACLERVVAGQPASVKYDPANPGNSILIADDWSGLH